MAALGNATVIVNGVVSWMVVAQCHSCGMWICLPNMLVGQASEWTLVVSGPVVFH